LSWDEPPLPTAFFEEARGCFRRARPRRLQLFALAALVGMAVGGWIWKVGVPVEGWVVLRAVENHTREGESSSTSRELRRYLTEAVFSREALLEALRKEARWKDRADRLTPERIDEIREDIGVDIQGNTFIEDRAPGDPPRSMRLRVSWRANDGAEAQAMAEMLVGMVTRAQAQKLAEEDERARGATEAAVAQARRMVDRLLEEKRVLEAVPTPPALAVLALQRQLKSAQDLLAQAQTEAVRVGITRHADGEEPWRFSVLDRPSPWVPTSAKLRAIVVAIFTTLGGYPLLLLLMGAFSWRLAEVQDAEKLGFAVLGEIPGHSVWAEAASQVSSQTSNH